MNFNYKFLVCAQTDEELNALKETLETDFKGCEIHATTVAQDAVDFCRANVYDLIVIERQLDNMDAEKMAGQIRAMENDNLTTGVLVIEKEGQGEPARFANYDHIMLVGAPFKAENYLHSAKVLLSLKQ